MKIINIALVVLIVLLQYKLWIGAGSFVDVWRIHQAIMVQVQENGSLTERNAALDAEVKDLKQGFAAIEERARYDLGMIKRNETFFQLVEQ